MQVQEYLVTIGMRRAELSGLKELPGSSKDRLTPLLLLAPWLATVPLSRALEKFEESYSSRPYFVDVDSYYRVNENWNDAKAEWTALYETPADVDLWWSILEDFPNANPCLLVSEQSIDSARQQISWARENNRTFCIRLNYDKNGMPQWIPELLEELAEEGANDFAIVLEFGLVDDALTVAASASSYVNTFASIVSPETPIAISCTSFPSDFTQFDGLDEERFSNRELLALVRQGTNHPTIIYGDWGSTKPRSHGIASPPKRRIDYPTDNAWVISRDNGDPIEFDVAAQRIVESDYWTGDLGIWGEQLIEGTAEGQDFAIDTMPKMYSVRINIHLHRQAFFGDLPPPNALDEEWDDDDF